MAETPRIAYLTGEYPRPTDTFIQREVAELRKRGLEITTISVRRPKQAPQDESQRAEREATSYLLPPSPFRLIAAHAGAIFRSPGSWLAPRRCAGPGGHTSRDPGSRRGPAAAP